MTEFKCTRCNKTFGFMREERPEHLKVMCPWCGSMQDIGTKRRENKKPKKSVATIPQKVPPAPKVARKSTGKPRGRPKKKR